MSNAVEVAPIGLSPKNQNVLGLIMAELARQYPTVRIDIHTNIFTEGLADSQALFDVILKVEEQSGMGFDQESEHLDFDNLTPLTLAQAYKVP